MKTPLPPEIENALEKTWKDYSTHRGNLSILIYQLMQMIEMFPASEEQTATVNFAGQILTEVCPTGELLKCSYSKRSEDFPKIVCLCGSTRFRSEFQKAFYAEGHKGNVVLTVYCYKDDPCCKGEDDWTRLDSRHKKQIDLSDEILVLNVGGYVGDSTRSEIEYAKLTGKPVRFAEGCEYCGTALNRNGCYACGAPICCPKCCKETTEESVV